MNSYTIQLEPTLYLSDDQFYCLCRNNPDIKFEVTTKGELIVMSPTGGETGNYNSEINAEFVIWNRQTQLGKVFDSSTCFIFPNGAKRSPDVAWIHKQRWETLTSEQKEKFPPIAPDFVLELMSPSDSLKAVREKMLDYQENQVKLGWLINQKNQQVEIYRLEQPTEILEYPLTLSGEKVLPGFTLDLTLIWH